MITDLTAPLAATLNHAVSDCATGVTVSEGFPPVLGKSPTVLVLGSLPGRASLAAGEYYAQRRNAFWRIMSELCGADPEHEYHQRLNRLTDAGVALWDVLHSAVRPGSLDADIVRSTERVNDIAGLLAANPGIDLIAFNGRKAAASYARHVAPLLDAAAESGDITRPLTVTLPSTSPAFAAMRFEQKLELWRSTLLPRLRAAR